MKLHKSAPTWAYIVDAALSESATAAQAYNLREFLPYGAFKFDNHDKHLVCNRDYRPVACLGGWPEEPTIFGWEITGEQFAQLVEQKVVDDGGYLHEGYTRMGAKDFKEYHAKATRLLSLWEAS